MKTRMVIRFIFGEIIRVINLLAAAVVPVLFLPEEFQVHESLS